MHQRQFCGFKNVIDEIIPFLPVSALVAFVVQFNPQDWLECFGVAQQEINVLTVNSICVGTILPIVASFGIEQITKFYFGKYLCGIPNYRFEIEKEIQFSR